MVSKQGGKASPRLFSKWSENGMHVDMIIFTGVDKCLSEHPIFQAILIGCPIEHAKKWVLKSKVGIRSRHN